MIKRIVSAILVVLGIIIFSGAGVMASAATTSSSTVSPTPPLGGP